MKKPIVITIAAASVVLIGAAGVAAHSQRDLLEEFVSHEKEVTATDMTALTALHEENQSSSISPRPWMAKDAEDIRLRFVTTDEPGWDIRFETKTGLTPALLEAGKCSPVDAAPKPALTVEWFPKTITGQVYECTADGSFVTQQGDTVYGWGAEA